MNNKETKIYETISENGLVYRFEDDGSHVDISVNGNRWGCSDGDRFIKALLRDIKKLKEKI